MPEIVKNHLKLRDKLYNELRDEFSTKTSI